MKIFKIGLIVAMSLFAVPAFSQVVIQQFQPGYRLIDGSKLNSLVSALNNIQGKTTTPGNVSTNKLITTNTVPTLTSCGTSPAVAGSRVAGTVTMGTASPTGCVITFAGAYTSVPHCVVTWQSNLAAMAYTVTAAAITLTQTATSSNLVNYVCVSRPGG